MLKIKMDNLLWQSFKNKKFYSPLLHHNTTNQKLLHRGASTTKMGQRDFLIGLQEGFKSL